MKAKEFLHSDRLHEDDSVFDPGGKQEYTEEQLIRFAELWAEIKTKELKLTPGEKMAKDIEDLEKKLKQ